MVVSRTGGWIEELDHDGPAIVGVRFVHHKRPKTFPIMYHLNHPHPLRPESFTAENYPGSGRRQFHDYVFVIKTERGFMKAWQQAGAAQDTPCDDVETNQANGTLLHHVPVQG